MNDNQKDNRSTNNQSNQPSKKDKPIIDNEIYPIKEPATDAEDTGSKAQKEHQDTEHPHTYTPPVGDKTVNSEETQNSNPGKSENSDQNLNQAV